MMKTWLELILDVCRKPMPSGVGDLNGWQKAGVIALIADRALASDDVLISGTAGPYPVTLGSRAESPGELSELLKVRSRQSKRLDILENERIAHHDLIVDLVQRLDVLESAVREGLDKSAARELDLRGRLVALESAAPIPDLADPVLRCGAIVSAPGAAGEWCSSPRPCEIHDCTVAVGGNRGTEPCGISKPCPIHAAPSPSMTTEQAAAIVPPAGVSTCSHNVPHGARCEACEEIPF